MQRGILVKGSHFNIKRTTLTSFLADIFQIDELQGAHREYFQAASLRPFKNSNVPFDSSEYTKNGVAVHAPGAPTAVAMHKLRLENGEKAVLAALKHRCSKVGEGQLVPEPHCQRG